MRLGISTDLNCKSPQEWAESIRSLGCGAVVFPVDYTADEKTVWAYADAAEAWGLVIAETGCWCNPISPDPKEREQALERCREQLRLADAVGARCCVNVAGAAGAKWSGAYKGNFSEETWDLTVRTIQDIIDAVRPQHTCFTIEPMPYMVPMDPDQYVRLMEEVDRDRFAVHMDFCNWLNTPEKYYFHEAFLEECFAKLGPYIKSCHLKDVQLTHELTCHLKEVPCGQGEINLENYIRLAEQYDPEMPMIMEHLKSDQAYLDSVRYLKQRLQPAGIRFF